MFGFPHSTYFLGRNSFHSIQLAVQDRIKVTFLSTHAQVSLSMYGPQFLWLCAQ